MTFKNSKKKHCGNVLVEAANIWRCFDRQEWHLLFLKEYTTLKHGNIFRIKNSILKGLCQKTFLQLFSPFSFCRHDLNGLSVRHFTTASPQPGLRMTKTYQLVVFNKNQSFAYCFQKMVMLHV